MKGIVRSVKDNVSRNFQKRPGIFKKGEQFPIETRLGTSFGQNGGAYPGGHPSPYVGVNFSRPSM